MAALDRQRIEYECRTRFYLTPHPTRDAVQTLLRQHPEGLTITEIERALERPNMRRVVSNLVQSGYVTNLSTRGTPARYVVDVAEQGT